MGEIKCELIFDKINNVTSQLSQGMLYVVQPSIEVYQANQSHTKTYHLNVKYLVKKLGRGLGQFE